MLALNSLEQTTSPAKFDSSEIDKKISAFTRRLENVEKEGINLTNEDIKEQIQIDEIKKLVSGLVTKINQKK